MSPLNRLGDAKLLGLVLYYDITFGLTTRLGFLKFELSNLLIF